MENRMRSLGLCPKRGRGSDNVE